MYSTQQNAGLGHFFTPASSDPILYLIAPQLNPSELVFFMRPNPPQFKRFVLNCHHFKEEVFGCYSSLVEAPPALIGGCPLLPDCGAAPICL